MRCTPTPFDEPTRRWLDGLTDEGRAMVVVRDAHRKTVWISDNAAEVIGHPGVDVASRLYSLVPPEDQRVLLELSRQLRERDAKIGVATIHIVQPDGRVQVFVVQLHNRLDDPSVGGVVSVAHPSGPPLEQGGLLQGLHTVSTDLLVVQNEEGRSTYVSPSVERLLGVGPDRLRVLEPDLVHADDHAAYEAARNRVLSGGPDERLRLRLCHEDGRELTFDTVIANRFEDRAIGGLLIVARDVTELAGTEAELAETRMQLEAIIEHTADVPITVDASATIVYCGANAKELLGYAPAEMVGRSAFDFVHPDDRDAAIDTFTRFLRAKGASSPVLRAQHADGEWVLVEVVGTDASDVPGLGGYVLSLRGVSERLLQQRRYDLALRNASGAALILDLEGRMVWSSHGVETFGDDAASLGESLDLTSFEAVPPVDQRKLFASLVERGHGTTERLFGRLEVQGADRRWVEVVLTNLVEDPAIEGIVCNIQDVDAVVRANEAGNRLVKVLESTTDMALIFDRDFHAIWGNAAARKHFGHFPADDDTMRRAMPAWTWAAVQREIVPTLRTESTWRGELAVTDQRGKQIPLDTIALAHRDAGGDIEYYSVVARDISEQKALEQRLHARARHDPLTGLPNRVLLTEQLEVALQREVPLAIVFLDLDQFKEVNDSRGHDVGDRLLVAAANRLRHATRQHDVIARFGGDEFVVLLRDVASLDTATERAGQILDALRGPVHLDELEVFVTASVGVAVSTDVTDVADLIARADTAMYAAKERGRDQVTAYSEDLRDRAVHRLDTAQQLRRALGDDQLEVWFQPIIDTALRVPIGFEALARWRHPDHGIVTPDDFITVAEETGLILPLGTELLRRTLATVAELGDVAAGCTIAVNISARQLADADLPARLAEELERNGILPGLVCLEITESAVMQDIPASMEALTQLRRLGVRMAVDDFGTGYSSLAYLKRFPVDILKIDREFVAGLDLASDWDRSLAAGIVSLGHSLGLAVVAEGVESQEQADILERLGCDALQGFLYSEPVPASELVTTLERLKASPGAPVSG